jgi:hypothetical protein
LNLFNEIAEYYTNLMKDIDIQPQTGMTRKGPAYITSELKCQAYRMKKEY